METLLEDKQYAFGWNKMFESVTGWDPGKEFLPALPAAIFIYMSAYIIGLLLHTFTRMVVPSSVRIYVLDFVKTMTFCTFPFGHGIMRKNYGESGYMSAMVPTMFLSLMTLRGGDGNPISVWLQYYRRIIPLWKCILKTLIQIAAGFAAYRLGIYILGLELHPMYVARVKEYYDEFCSTDLHVPVYVGFLIEFCAVIYDCWFVNQTFTRNLYFDTVIKVVNSGLLVVSGVHLTGMYIHPAMATGHTWGCGDTSGAAHILIYWVGPIIGTWISYHLQKRFSLRGKAVKGSSKSRSHGNMQSDKQNVNGSTQVNGHNKKQKNGKRKFYNN
ncbi:aquaporin-11-like [Ruditapes philippinarum]|uniref:aquaporin-11-like n=1 Tax=Ruditapes philippinarum TaxID=129788 RepID=UPI00295BC98E|nr:aquaporin-11-like [Ruditapes philippinarum]